MHAATAGRWKLPLLGLALSLVTTATGMLAISGTQGALPRVVLAALALVVLLGVGQPVRWAAQCVAAVAASLVSLDVLVGLLLRETLLADAGDLLDPLSLGATLGSVLGLLVAAIVADRFGRACATIFRTQEEALRGVEALRPLDAVTHVTKWSHAELIFERELARARRHQQPLALLRVVVAQWDVVRTRLGSKRTAEVLAEVGQYLLDSSRVVDVVAYHGDATFDLLLPDTPGLGALVVARRVAGLRSAHPGVRLRVGVALLEDRDTTLDGLLAQGETAVAIAERLGRPYAVCSDDEAAAPTQEVAP